MIKKYMNMNELGKIILLAVFNIIIRLLGIFLVGQGNGILKLNEWSDLKTKSLFFAINVLMYLIIAVGNLFVYRLFNENKVNILSSIIQIFIIYVNIANVEFSKYTIWHTYSFCESILEYIMYFIMILILVSEIALCIRSYYQTKKRVALCNQAG